MVFKSKGVKSIDSDSELILSTDYYLHKTVMQSIEAPFKALENNNYDNGLKAVMLAGYLAEKLSYSAKVMTPEEEVKLKEYLVLETNKLKDSGIEEDSINFKSMLAYSKICYILKIVENKKPSSEVFKV